MLSATDYYPFGFEMPGRKYNIGDYRYGFNGKEADRKKEWASLVHYDYGFRIYNPALGRFLSVDPLTREYPWYTPYQFAGNKPIWAVDLDGLEEKYMITEKGKLTRPVITFLQAAFKFERSGLENVTWYSDEEYVSEFKGLAGPFMPRPPVSRENSIDRAIKKYATTTALNGPSGAITISKDEVVYEKSLSNRGDIYWLSLVGHEQSHVEDYLVQGELNFYINYGIDNLNYGYRGAFTEYLAYERGDALEDWLISNPQFIARISNPFEVYNENLDAFAIAEGKRFRLEAGIDAEIRFLEYQKSITSDLLSETLSSPSLGRGYDETVRRYRKNIKSLDSRINDLNIEKEKLSNELDKGIRR